MPKSLKDMNKELTCLEEANKRKELQEKIDREKRKLQGPSKMSKDRKVLGKRGDTNPLDLSDFEL